MAQCAKLDINNTVIELITVDDSISDKEQYCVDLFGGTWKEYSKDGSTRANPACIGGKYDSANDRFLFPQPFNSWTLDSNYIWAPPVDIPSDRSYGENQYYRLEWDEDNLRWKGYDDSGNAFYWNPDSSSWISI